MEILAAIEDSVVGAIGRGDAIGAHPLLFLLRLYQATGRDDLAGLMGQTLAASFDDESDSVTTLSHAAWLELLVETSALSDDQRVNGAIADRIAPLRCAWSSASVEDAAAAIGACLHAASLAQHRSLVPDAIDELETVIGRAYRPGEGVGALGGQVRAASTLLRAHSLTGRLPYAMLAEELILIAGRSPRMAPVDAVQFATLCESARVLCRLAALHDDPDYRRAAVVAPAADYRRDAALLLADQDACARSFGADAAIYGVALLELDSNLSTTEDTEDTEQ
jgi:hypothetical protein